MKTTTEFVQRLTITTDDAGHRTITRTSSADTVTEYYFSELSPEAQARAISDAIEEEQDAYYSGNPCHTYFTESDIIDAARDLEKSQPIEITQDQGCSWYGTARGAHWYGHPADWESVTEATDSGICYSMDICDTWNTYAARIIALQEAHEEATEQAEEHEYSRDIAECEQMETDAYTTNYALWERLEAVKDNELNLTIMYERIAERIEDAAEELTEDAARAVGNVVDGLIESERDYYASAEFWRDWLNDSDDRYTRDGERI